MKLDRRTFLQAAAAATAAGVLPRGAIAELSAALADDPRPRAIWLQGSGCDGCAISFLNSVHFATPDEVLTQVVAAEFQSNLMAAAGDLAVDAAIGAAAQPGYILIVEGAIPTGAQGRFCTLWPGMTMHQATVDFAANASFIVALGACASYGGVTGGAPNPTGAQGVGGILGDDPRLVNLPGCPAHPDWLVGTLTSLITTGRPAASGRAPAAAAVLRRSDPRQLLQARRALRHHHPGSTARGGGVHGVPRLQGQAHPLGLSHPQVECRRHRGIRRQLVRRGPLTLPRLHRTRLPRSDVSVLRVAAGAPGE
jgi:hydrogenase small subunit